MKLIVGLGNPGSKYEYTRHNLGFIMVDKFVAELNLKYKDKFDAQIVKTNVLGEEVIFLKPQTFMNLSGSSVKQVMDFYKISTEDVLIVFDDLAMDLGKIKIKIDSSAGGHNGVKDIINQLKTQKIFRIKFGILNEYKKNTKDFVLSNFKKDELKVIDEEYEKVKSIIYDFIKSAPSEYEKIISKYN